MIRIRCVAVAIFLASAVVVAQQPDARQVAQERAAAEREVPQLAQILELEPGMTVADVGSGNGANAIVFGKWIGSGKVFATDIGQRQLTAIRDYVAKEGLKNVTVIEGSPSATNLPPGCCDAIFMRDVYHHIGDAAAFDKSLLASLKPGGRLAIIDFRPDPGSTLPAGVPENRGGHGIMPGLVESELKQAGFTHVKTFEKWPEDASPREQFFLCLFRK